MGEAKRHRIGLGRAGKCESVTGKIGGDGWAGIRANIERERGKKRNRVRVEGTEWSLGKE